MVNSCSTSPHLSAFPTEVTYLNNKDPFNWWHLKFDKIHFLILFFFYLLTLMAMEDDYLDLLPTLSHPPSPNKATWTKNLTYMPFFFFLYIIIS